ncbi:hypothetical protein AUEXF2481DRAFT_426196 [Aureobasidium subglaciale EXF-2481]|uniref:SAP domain-containing protein n=1 Tax=Aureobasidium subglaciale (strain EXF-2481) TaxID=1043005 RepID=A0A074Y8J2_AURSE|nr:uncharacterized protein AUEXF2481DRAFT_426196 [Aureobasidium subglaciale EXF-2481]KAI5202156.1 hypothetical protein E4T38_05744 [Aureobasidium subglaciale]KAI5221105.1 hypothetical protein E4T40_05619 [Aureobasidium subglaciale]KAI5224433.1 hypothetical protein E4T41_05723 [Aureobasidium subglaciale]KAI5261015.1 hypothetical protein E4T46_05498 [Aureobasidium subglaciale]KEQ92314.1 hypothetical protein AUEXF2481DRAFT_426196 [Aureobasidium subglaciale EXF-2481]
MASETDLRLLAAQVDRKVKTLVNNDLKEICRVENLPVSGVKAALQKRISEVIASYLRRNDRSALTRLEYQTNNQGRTPPATSHQPSLARDTITPVSPAPHTTVGMPAYPRPAGISYHQTLGARPAAASRASVKFRESPFYQVKEAIMPTRELSEMPHNRHTLQETVKLSDAICTSLKADPSLRVMLYCATTSTLGPYAFNVDIAFPSQIEVKINGDEIRKSFKGLKNKPGTTKPVDITDLLRKAAGYQNDLHVTYALTKERFSLMVNLVKVTSATELAARLKQTGSRIPKDTVLREMAVKASDPDIVTTSTVMSLKDPISTMRINLPCRSNVCSHNQCFDGSYFLQLQEQAPTWTCPVCNKTLSYQSLCVDNYVQDILQNTSSSVDQVRVEADGQWKAVDNSDDTNSHHKSQPRAAYDNDSDDDIIEIQDTPKKSDAVEKIKTEGQSATPALAQQTPPVSRETSTVAPRPSAKRPSAAVIDLTLSDDEDEPPRPAKRTTTSQNTSYNTPASLQDGRFADLANRPSSIVGSGLPPINPGNPLALPPIKAPQPNGGLPQGQRLPWPTGAPVWSGTYRDSQSYSNSPS